MKVLRGLSTNKNHPLTKPFPEKNGFLFELRGGDVCEPVGFGTNWFTPPFPKRVWRWFSKWCLFPYLSWRFGKVGGYIGFKAYGVDSPIYGSWLCHPCEVYDGSQALCITIRPFANLSSE